MMKIYFTCTDKYLDQTDDAEAEHPVGRDRQHIPFIHGVDPLGLGEMGRADSVSNPVTSSANPIRVPVELTQCATPTPTSPLGDRLTVTLRTKKKGQEPRMHCLLKDIYSSNKESMGSE